MAQNPQKRPGQMRLHALQAIAHGADGMMFFQWRQSRAGAEKYHAAIVTHDGNEHTRIFRQSAQVGEELEQIAPVVAGTHLTSQVAIVLDWENWWCVEYLPAPSDRVRYLDLVYTYYRAFHQMNVAVDIVHPSSDISKYRVVVAPLLHMLHPGVAANLTNFVESGGTLLTTFFSGIVDENDHVGLGGYPKELRTLLGIRIEEIDPWTPDMKNELVIKAGPLAGTYPCDLWGELIHEEGAQTIGAFASDYYANFPALTVNQFGAGRAYYVATQINEELAAKLLREVCLEASIAPLIQTSSNIEVTRRVSTTGSEIYFLLNHTQQAQHLTLPSGTFTSLLTSTSMSGDIEIPAMDVVIAQKQ